MYLSLYCKGSKRVIEGLRVRGSWRPNRTAIYWPPLLWPSALCLSRSPGLLNRKARGPALCWMMAFFTACYHQLVSKTPSGVPRALSARCGFPYLILSSTSLIPNSSGAPTHQGLQGPPPPGFLYHILSPTSLDPNSSGAPRAPSAWCGFPYHILSLTSTP